MKNMFVEISSLPWYLSRTLALLILILAGTNVQNPCIVSTIGTMVTRSEYASRVKLEVKSVGHTSTSASRDSLASTLAANRMLCAMKCASMTIIVPEICVVDSLRTAVKQEIMVLVQQ